MDFQTMATRLEAGAYDHGLDALTFDFTMLCNNALSYNHCGSNYYRQAEKLYTHGAQMIQQAQGALAQLWKDYRQHPFIIRVKAVGVRRKILHSSSPPICRRRRLRSRHLRQNLPPAHLHPVTRVSVNQTKYPNLRRLKRLFLQPFSSWT